MIVRKNICEGFTHLKPKTKKEIIDSLMKSTDHYELLKAAESHDEHEQLYIKRLIEVAPDFFKNNEMNRWKLDDESKEMLKKHLSFKDNVTTLVKASDLLKDKKYMEMAMKKLLSGKPEEVKHKNELSKALHDVCLSYWKGSGIEFNTIMSTKILNNFSNVNSRVAGAESFVAKDIYLTTDGRGSIYCYLIGHTIKNDRISAMTYNLAAVRYEWY